MVQLLRWVLQESVFSVLFIHFKQVLGAIRQAVQHLPHYPEAHNLKGLVFEARSDYQSAAASYRLARCAVTNFSSSDSKSQLRDVSINLARSLSKVFSHFRMEIFTNPSRYIFGWLFKFMVYRPVHLQ